MKIIIPLAGKGKRFNDFLSPKPLIEIDGKPMIEHVVNYFPRKSQFIFICNEDHLAKTDLKHVLKRISPECQIVSVSHEKGPAYSVLQALDLVDDGEEVIVNYCDFIQVWDYNNFIIKLTDKKPDGAIISFKGFHPSSLGETYYAYMKVNEDQIVQEIKEKASYSQDRTMDFASTGTYYFSSGNLLKKYVKEFTSNQDYSLNNEFYMSLVYNLMIKDGLKIMNYEVEKFICLGTPRDYELYKFWSEFFLKYSPNLITFDNINLKVTNIFPLAGDMRDFTEIGIDQLNFLIPIMNKSLIYYSLKTHPMGIRNILIMLEKHQEEFNILSYLPSEFKYNSEALFLPKKLAGNAETILQARSLVRQDEPVCVSGCNNILDYDERLLSHLMEDKTVDVILFAFSHHECVLRNPKGLHYAKTREHIFATEIVAKEVISDNPYKDLALEGTAIYKRAEDLFSSIDTFLDLKKESNPFFLSAVNLLIERGKKVVIFEVNKFIPLRTVENYNEFTYWQDYFDKLSYHPYSKILQ